MTEHPEYPWLSFKRMGEEDKAAIDTTDLDLTQDSGRVVTQYGDMPELSHRMHVAIAINEHYVMVPSRIRLVKVLDQGEPFATLVAESPDQADLWAMQLRACWGTDEDSLFEIYIETPDDIEKTIDRMEG